MLARTVLALCLVLAACGGKAKPATVDNRPLFDRLGGIPAITAVVKAFVQRTGADPRINLFFTNTDIPRLEKMMVDDICERTGGPCKYTGKPMKESHATMKLTDADFEAFMEDLEATLVEFKVPEREKAEVLADFRSRRADVMP